MSDYTINQTPERYEQVRRKRWKPGPPIIDRCVVEIRIAAAGQPDSKRIDFLTERIRRTGRRLRLEIETLRAKLKASRQERRRLLRKK